MGSALKRSKWLTVMIDRGSQWMLVVEGNTQDDQFQDCCVIPQLFRLTLLGCRREEAVVGTVGGMHRMATVQ